MKKVKQFVAGKLAYFDATIEGFSSLFLSRLSQKSAGIFLIVSVFVFFEVVFPNFAFAFGKEVTKPALSSPIQTKTRSHFTEKISIKKQELKFQTKTKVDLTLKPGESKVLQNGVMGEKVIQTKVVFHKSKEFSKESRIISESKPTHEIIAIGVDPDEKTLDTPYGTIKYHSKLRVWATSYDPNCNGCNETTAIGLKAGYGVIAVDPKIIPLRSKVYVPGYGIAIAGDTGGSIKGLKIDLGFDDIRNGWWSSRFTDIYLLSS